MNRKEKEQVRKKGERRTAKYLKIMEDDLEIHDLANAVTSHTSHSNEHSAQFLECETPDPIIDLMKQYDESEDTTAKDKDERDLSSAATSMGSADEHELIIHNMEEDEACLLAAATTCKTGLSDEMEVEEYQVDKSLYFDLTWPATDDSDEEQYLGCEDDKSQETEICADQGGGDDLFVTDAVDLTELHNLLSACDDDEKPNPDQKLQHELGLWAARNNVVHNTVNELLVILREHAGLTNLPKNVKTLLQTPRNTTDVIKPLAGGTFWYYGILQAVKPHLSETYLATTNTVSIDIFIDGISLYNSVRCSVWPIAGCLVGSKSPFIIALWCGNTKEPSDVDAFFERFIEEAKELMNKFTIQNKEYKLVVRNFIADAPARAFMRKVRVHNSYFACERCHIRGEWKAGRITYDPKEKAELRTDETFATKVHKEHHTGTSPLEQLATKMISQCPIDGMHLLYLGVTKRIIKMLCEPKASKQKMSNTVLEKLSSRIVSYASFFPSEFSRKPRKLTEWKLFKATEWRRILLYDGILFLNDLQNNLVYGNFLLLHCAVRILSDNCSRDFYDDAEYLLQKFVEHAGSSQVYDQHFVVFNVHLLTHFAAECKRHGAIEEFSAFKYENFLGCLRTLLHAPGRTMSQIVCRVIEKARLLKAVLPLPEKDCSLSQAHSHGPLNGLSGYQFRKVEQSGRVFRLSKNDACCTMKDGEIVVIENIVQVSDKNVWIVGKTFEKKEDFYTYPLKSSCLGIFRVTELGVLRNFPIQDVCKKNVLLPLESSTTSSFLCIPLLHQQ